ncbi:MAG: hypothetical protein M3409_01290 [Gemmatimonadota bacterium]|nr:hypothetical protein [Gemmatimonadota bacterium]
MIGWYLLFFFVTFGSKLVLAVITIYLICPADPRCGRCEGETLLIRMGWFGRVCAPLLLWTVQRRWCPACGWEGFCRIPRRVRRETIRIRVRPADPDSATPRPSRRAPPPDRSSL